MKLVKLINEKFLFRDNLFAIVELANFQGRIQKRITRSPLEHHHKLSNLLIFGVHIGVQKRCHSLSIGDRQNQDSPLK